VLPVVPSQSGSRRPFSGTPPRIRVRIAPVEAGLRDRYSDRSILPRSSQSLAEQVSNGGIPIDLPVNNAGFGLRGEFRDLSLPRQLDMFRLNNQAVVELTYSLLPGILKRRQKGIINISSTAGFQPIPFASVYSATKAFLTTSSLARRK
jgi:short-subunit dehydrogenase